MSTNNNKGNEDEFMKMVRQNAEKTREARASTKQWFSLADGETAQLEFTGEFEPVKKDFDNDGIPERIQYEFKMKDLRLKNPTIQTWGLSMTWAQKVENLLLERHRFIEASREGAKKNNTNYTFKAINRPNTVGSSGSGMETLD